ALFSEVDADDVRLLVNPIENERLAVSRNVEVNDQRPWPQCSQRSLDAACEIHRPKFLVRQRSLQHHQCALVVAEKSQLSRAAIQNQLGQWVRCTVRIDRLDQQHSTDVATGVNKKLRGR